jgi:uncharacterized protein
MGSEVSGDQRIHDMAAIVIEILRGYALPERCAHGVVHWARVLENGLRVAEANGADQEVVSLFAVFHDSRRVNQYRDDGHGLRGAEACRLHTDGLTEGESTLQACWDADRLDLGRVGNAPKPNRLCTDTARELIKWATARAVSNYEPSEVLASWGLRQGRPNQ